MGRGGGHGIKVSWVEHTTAPEVEKVCTQKDIHLQKWRKNVGGKYTFGNVTMSDKRRGV